MMSATDLARQRADCVIPQAISGIALAALDLIRLPLDRIRNVI